MYSLAEKNAISEGFSKIVTFKFLSGHLLKNEVSNGLIGAQSMTDKMYLCEQQNANPSSGSEVKKAYLYPSSRLNKCRI